MRRTSAPARTTPFSLWTPLVPLVLVSLLTACSDTDTIHTASNGTISSVTRSLSVSADTHSSRISAATGTFSAALSCG